MNQPIEHNNDGPSKGQEIRHVPNPNEQAICQACAATEIHHAPPGTRYLIVAGDSCHSMLHTNDFVQQSEQLDA